MNNGFTSEMFFVERGIRQGEPLSPYLFIIALEILNIAIRESKDIEGIQVCEGIIKLCAFANDLTTFVKMRRLFAYYKIFSRHLETSFEIKWGKNRGALDWQFAPFFWRYRHRQGKQTDYDIAGILHVW